MNNNMIFSRENTPRLKIRTKGMEASRGVHKVRQCAKKGPAPTPDPLPNPPTHHSVSPDHSGSPSPSDPSVHSVTNFKFRI